MSTPRKSTKQELPHSSRNNAEPVPAGVSGADAPKRRDAGSQRKPGRSFSFLMPKGSLARRLVLRLLPAALLLLAADLVVTWAIATKTNWHWDLDDIFWLIVAGQSILVVLFVMVLVSGVRSGLSGVNRLTRDIQERSVDDLQPLDGSGIPAEVLPLVTHFNDLLVRLDDAIQSQRRFIGHAAHQLRTPLSGLKMESELMLARQQPQDVRDRAERIKTATDRMIRLGQQLLVLARADDSSRPKDSFVRMDLSEWVRDSGAQWIPAARAKHVDVQLTVPQTPVWVDMDPLLMEELLGNLMDNALRYGSGASTIGLHVGANPPTLLVEDDGPGIAQEDARRVFDAFYRSARANAQGSGLGLAIVREIARAHGAWWGLLSRPEFPGTRISIVFPGPRIGATLATRQKAERATSSDRASKADIS